MLGVILIEGIENRICFSTPRLTAPAQKYYIRSRRHVFDNGAMAGRRGCSSGGSDGVRGAGRGGGGNELPVDNNSSSVCQRAWSEVCRGLGERSGRPCGEKNATVAAADSEWRSDKSLTISKDEKEHSWRRVRRRRVVGGELEGGSGWGGRSV